MTTTSKRDEFGRFIKKNDHEPVKVENNRGLGEIGSISAAASDRPSPITLHRQAIKDAIGSASIIPEGVAGVWHSHKKQGINPLPSNVLVPGATFGMIIPTDEFTCRFLIRVDLRDASGMSTSMTCLEMGSEDAMKFLNENFTQTRFQQQVKR